MARHSLPCFLTPKRPPPSATEKKQSHLSYFVKKLSAWKKEKKKKLCQCGLQMEKGSWLSSPCLASGFLHHLSARRPSFLRALCWQQLSQLQVDMSWPAGCLTCHSIYIYIRTYILAPAKSTDLSDIYASRRRGERSMEQVISVHHLTDNYADVDAGKDTEDEE